MVVPSGVDFWVLLISHPWEGRPQCAYLQNPLYFGDLGWYQRRTKARIQVFCMNFTCFTNNFIVVLPGLLIICLPNFRESEAGVVQTWHDHQVALYPSFTIVYSNSPNFDERLMPGETTAM